jgi:putative tricarboxylic transport membrane protein
VEHEIRGKKENISLDADTAKENRTVSFREFKGVIRTLIRSSLIGTGIGALPGCGPTIAAFVGYGVAKRTSPNSKKFGTGALEGIAAAEAANNAVVGANLIPLFTLGIPGTLTAAMLIGAFMVHGVEPGPLMFKEHGPFIYGIYGSLLIANALNLVIGGVGLRVFAKVVQIPKTIIYPIIIFVCITGAYIADNTLFAVAVMLIFGIIGYFMKRLDFSFVTFLIGFVLGPMFEFSLQQTMSVSMNNPMVIFQRPIALTLLILTGVFLCWGFISRRKKGV